MRLSRFFRFRRYRLRNLEYPMLIYIIALSVLSLLILNSAMVNDASRDSTIRKQILGLTLGVIFMVFFALLDYHVLMNYGLLVYIGTVLILAGVLVPGIGVSSHNATRWMSIAGIQIQPSEFAKIGVILFFAMFFSTYSDVISSPKIVVGSLLLIGVPLALIIKEPDLSTTIVITVLFVSMLYDAGISRRWIIGVSATVAVIAVVVLFILPKLDINLSFLRGYQMNRILSWLYPDKYAASGLTTQQDNSVLAIASGQLHGKGLNTTSFESVKNGRFLSEENCDFIFAVIGEELGFSGSMAILGLLALIVFHCLKLAFTARDMSGRLICVGYATLIAFQSFVNVGVSTGLLPNTGLPLPFLSAGVSSLFSLLCGYGVVLNVGLQRRTMKKRSGYSEVSYFVEENRQPIT
jgi:rod shape determining protein RodA